MQGKPVAIDTERCVNAVRNFACSHSNAVHRYPAKQKYVKPHVENPDHVHVGVLAANTTVQPCAVSLIPVDALVTDVAVHSSFRLNHFAVGA